MRRGRGLIFFVLHCDGVDRLHIRERIKRNAGGNQKVKIFRGDKLREAVIAFFLARPFSEIGDGFKADTVNPAIRIIDQNLVDLVIFGKISFNIVELSESVLYLLKALFDFFSFHFCNLLFSIFLIIAQTFNRFKRRKSE